MAALLLLTNEKAFTLSLFNIGASVMLTNEDFAPHIYLSDSGDSMVLKDLP